MIWVLTNFLRSRRPVPNRYQFLVYKAGEGEGRGGEGMNGRKWEYRSCLGRLRKAISQELECCQSPWTNYEPKLASFRNLSMAATQRAAPMGPFKKSPSAKPQRGFGGFRNWVSGLPKVDVKRLEDWFQELIHLRICSHFPDGRRQKL